MEAKLREHKDLLRELYIVQNNALKDVKNFMKAQYQLDVGPSVYTRLFNEWNFRKYKKDEVWAYVDHRVRKREKQGKRSNVYINGALQRPDKIKKEIARHVTTLQQLAQATAPSPRTPEGWSIASPGPQPSSHGQHSATSISAPDIKEIVTQEPHGDTGLAFKAADANFPQPSTVPLNTIEVAECHMLADDMQKCRALSSSDPYFPNLRLGIPYSQFAGDVVRASRFPESSFLGTSFYTTSIKILVCTLRDGSHIVRELKDPTVGRYNVLCTALFVAARKGYTNATEALLSSGMEVDSQNSLGRTCLQVAAENNHPELVILLLAKGARINHKSQNGNTAWTLICGMPSHESVAQILDNHHAEKNVHLSEYSNVLLKAVFGSRVEPVRTMLQRGMDPSFAPHFEEGHVGWAPLHAATAIGNYELIKMLIEAGADVNGICTSMSPYSPRALPFDVYLALSRIVQVYPKTPLDLVIESNIGNSNDRAQAKAYLLAHGALTAQELLSLPPVPPSPRNSN